MKKIIDANLLKDKEKQSLLREIAKLCAECFQISAYPNQPFNFPFHVLPPKLALPINELHIRIPDILRLPSKLKIDSGIIPTRDEIECILRSCPAIENIQLNPNFQRHGFLNALMKEMGKLGIPYVNISNIENVELAIHYFELSQQDHTGVEFVSEPSTINMDDRIVFHPTFSIDLRKRFNLP